MKSSYKDYFKKLGTLGFLFFLVKGIIWVLIFFGVGNWLVGLLL